jgi:hypothetical protein
MRNKYASHTDFSAFEGLIAENPKFLPSNVDGICERNGHFLVMEWKRPNEKISKGQELLLKALAQTPKFMVFIMVGDTDNGINLDHYWILDEKGNPFKKGKDFEEFKEYFKFWYELVSD